MSDLLFLQKGGWSITAAAFDLEESQLNWWWRVKTISQVGEADRSHPEKANKNEPLKGFILQKTTSTPLPFIQDHIHQACPAFCHTFL